MFLKEYSISFLVVFRLIGFGLVVLKLRMFKVCGITGISKIEFFNFFRTERVKPSKKKIRNHSKPPKLVIQSLFKQFQQILDIFLVFQ